MTGYAPTLVLPPTLTGLTITADILLGSVVAVSGTGCTEVVGENGTYVMNNSPSALSLADCAYTVKYKSSGTDYGWASTEFAADGEWITEQTILEAVNEISGGAGGAYNLTVTLTDSVTSSDIQFGTVTLLSGNSEIATAISNASGVAVPTANNGTYTINVTAPGYNGYTGSVTISGNGSKAISLVALAITPATAPKVTGYMTCYDAEGNVLAGQLFVFTPIGTVDGSTGGSFSNTPWSVQSASNGLVQTTFVTNCNYYVKRGNNGTQVKFTAPNATFQLPDCLG